ncbi:hypothetical protein M422DRAFT_777289 [Sphaerobolus stellatus SS14]|nr:hypothetical protein M422DRAFT_777289 [Sphaerobolus stellatus SS14]
MARTPTLPTELLYIIFAFCSGPTLSSSCRVCKSWSEPALSVLWEEVPHPIILFRLLGPLVPKTQVPNLPEGNFSRPLRPEDWRNFDRYAPRVRSLKWIEHETRITHGLKINRKVFAEIAHIKPRLTLLPKLYSLTVNASDMDYITLFLHLSLKDLTIEFDHDYTSRHRGVEGVIDVLLLLLNMASGLEVLDIDCSYPVSLVKSPFSTVLRSLPLLKKLILPRYWLADWVVEILGTLPKLERFDWSWDRGDGSPQDLSGFSTTLQGNDSFPSLARMSLELDFPVVQTFFEQSTVLERISSLGITTIKRAPPLEIRQFLQMCAEKATYLMSLSVDGFPNNSASVNVKDIIDMQILEPLLSCPNLTSFVIQYPTPLDLSEHDLRLIGIKLPKLRRLLLGESPFHLSPPPLSLSALLVVLENYPCLTEIGLYLDSNASFMNPAKSIKPHPTLRLFFVGTSPLSTESTTKVSLFLSRLITMNSNYHAPIDINSSLGYDDKYEDTLTRAEFTRRIDVAAVWEDVTVKVHMLVAARDEERRFSEEMQKSQGDQS